MLPEAHRRVCCHCPDEPKAAWIEGRKPTRAALREAADDAVMIGIEEFGVLRSILSAFNGSIEDPFGRLCEGEVEGIAAYALGSGRKGPVPLRQR